jgi:hypothetical protein
LSTPPERFAPDDPREWLNRARSNLAQASILARLLTLLEESGEAVPDRVKDAGRLTRFAVEPRYPGFGRPVTEAEYQTLLDVAREVVHWAQRRVAKLLA